MCIFKVENGLVYQLMYLYNADGSIHFFWAIVGETNQMAA